MKSKLQREAAHKNRSGLLFACLLVGVPFLAVPARADTLVLECTFPEPGHDPFTIEVDLAANLVTESGNGGGQFHAEITDTDIRWTIGGGATRDWNRYTGDLTMTIGQFVIHWTCLPRHKLG
ncbi:MAG: hypothetical protein WCA81_06270 [Rhizomicrobium sp.]